jgi:3-phosphoshikimate 1-carboxyvinyltransferase
MNSLIIYPSQNPSQPLIGTLQVPGDKSISHRAVILGSIASGTTTVENLLEGEDVLCTVEAMREVGVPIEKVESGKWKVAGVGIGGLRQPSKILYCGNSGTTLRLLTGLIAGLPITATLTGDASLNSRPMGRVIEPLQKMGATIEEVRNGEGRFIKVTGGNLRGGTFRIPVASAQLKSALLLAGLVSGREIVVSEPLKSRDHTERMLKAMGATVLIKGFQVRLKPVKKLKGQRIIIPGDFSSAAFFLVAGLISRDPKTRLVVRNVGMNPTRTGALEVLKKMGGRIAIQNRRTVCGELVADLVALPSRLKGIKILPAIMPRLIDEVPILSVAAAVARGKTIIRGAGELRIKETDRIRALATELLRFGISVKELKDGLEITGRDRPAGAQGRSYGDHRIAMSLAVLGTIAEGKTEVEDIDCIATSFPNFQMLLKKIGVRTNKTL